MKIKCLRSVYLCSWNKSKISYNYSFGICNLKGAGFSLTNKQFLYKISFSSNFSIYFAINFMWGNCADSYFLFTKYAIYIFPNVSNGT